MNLRDLTLDQIYDLELKNSPLVGNRSAVFLAVSERAVMNRASEPAVRPPQRSKSTVSGIQRFKVGDSVRVHTKVIEGAKERIQVFRGIVIGQRGRGLNEMFTVRRISYGEGVERIFRVNSPSIEKIEFERKSDLRGARLAYPRKHFGKGATFGVKAKEGRFAKTRSETPSKRRRRKMKAAQFSAMLTARYADL